MELWESFLCLVPSLLLLIGVVLLVVCQNLSLGQGCEDKYIVGVKIVKVKEKDYWWPR